MPKYPNRIQAQDALFHWCRQAGLKLRIVDRNYRRDNPRYLYPVRYWPLILPDIDYRLLGGIYKLHAYALNLNSVTESESMFAKRVYDALACGSVVISNESKGMERAFPEVAVIRNPEALLHVLSETEEERRRRKLDGIRRIMSGNTSYDRIRQLLERCELFHEKQERKVAVIVSPEAKRPEKVRKMFDCQTYPTKLFFNARDKREGELAELVQDCDMIAIWTDEREYEPRFLEDAINAFRYTACRYVVSGDGDDDRAKHAYVDEVRDKYLAVFWRTDDWAADLTALPDSFPFPGGYHV